VSDPLDNSERAELERLRAAVTVPRQPRRVLWRNVLAVSLITLGVLVAPLAVTAVWLDSEVTDTDRYVATVAPLAHDPALQRAVTDRITTAVFERVDIAGLTNQTADALGRQGVPDAVSTGLHALAGPIANGVRGWAHDQVETLVHSEDFARIWTDANRAAHAQLVAAFTGNQAGAVTIAGDAVRVKLAPFVDAVKRRLVERGFGLAAKIPEVDTELVIFSSPDVGRAQRYFRLLHALGTWLPVVGLALIAGGVWAASARRRAVLGAAVGVAVAMVLLGLVLTAARARYLDTVPNASLPSDAAAVVFDTLVVYLRTGLRAVLATAVVVAVVAYLAGPGPAAVAIRRTVHSGASRIGPRTGRFGVWTGRYRRGLEAAIVAAAAAALVFWNYPTAGVVIGLAVAALVLVVLIELVSTGPARGRPAA
jgi:hypothetical protein